MPWSWSSSSHAELPLLSVKGYASDEMEHNYRRAKELSQEHSGSVHQFRAIRGLWVFHLVRGQLANARGLAENLLALAHPRAKLGSTD